MRKIWYEERLTHLSSFRNLKLHHEEIIREVLEFVEFNKEIFDEWIMDKWVDDRNIGRVQLWDGAWRVIPFPINAVGPTAVDGDYQLSEMVSFTKLFNTSLDEVKRIGPKIYKSFVDLCPKTAEYIKDDMDNKFLKSATISRLSPGTKINPHKGDIDSMRLHFPVVTDPEAWISVRGRKRTWEVGDLFAFHDNDKHWAQHNGTNDRIVVIFDYSIEKLEEETEFQLEDPYI